VHLGILRRELGEDATKPQRVLAQRGSHPVVAGGRRVSLVEDEIDDLEHRREPLGALGPARDLERHLRLGERTLGPHDALRDRRLRQEKGARDLRGGEAAEQAQCQRDARLGGEDRVASGEHQTQQIVADVVVELRVDIRCFAQQLFLLSERLDLLGQPGLPAQRVDRPVLGDPHQPAARVVGHARLGPLRQRRDQRVLRELLRRPDVAHDAREPRDQPRRLDTPECVDGSVHIAHPWRAITLPSAPRSPRVSRSKT